MTRLIVFSGLPGVGKSTIARAWAARVDAIWLRIDTIEQAIKESDIARSVDEAGYLVAHGVAIDNLRLGRDVVNPRMLVRKAWHAIGIEAGAS